jgi:ketosteroid isomerase-like protein
MKDNQGTLDKSALESEIKLLDERRIRATIESDLATLDGILAEDLVWTHASGNSDTKAQWMGKLREGKVRYRAILFEELRVRAHGDSAILNGRGRTAVFHGGVEDEFAMSTTAVYTRAGDGWRLAAMQVTKRP